MFFKRKLLPIIVVLLIACSAATALASTYVGNARTHKLHYADCRYVGEMNVTTKSISKTATKRLTKDMYLAKFVAHKERFLRKNSIITH